MKSFSKIFIIIALFSAIGFTANAQPGHRPPPDPNKKAEEQTNHMKKTLQLNELQINKVEAINLNYANEIHKIHEANKAEREAMRKAHEDIDSKRNEELKAVLTETQYKMPMGTAWEILMFQNLPVINLTDSLRTTPILMILAKRS